MSWEVQPGGSFLGAASSRAVDWAGGDPHKLAAIGFVAWTRDMSIEPFWAADDWATLSADSHIGPLAVTVFLDQAKDFQRFRIERMSEASEFHDHAVVRVLNGGNPVIHILGLDRTHILDTSRYDDDEEMPRHQLLRPIEWLTLFPRDAAYPPTLRVGCDSP